jgi:hypothetical protein
MIERLTTGDVGAELHTTIVSPDAGTEPAMWDCATLFGCW